MPILGEIRKAIEVGHKGKGLKYIWDACEICGKERWVFLCKGHPISNHCRICAYRLCRIVTEEYKGIPQIGDIRRSQELGFKARGQKYIRVACPDCGKERWVNFHIRNGKLSSVRCRHCATTGIRSSQWKGGRINNPDGYIKIRLNPSDFFWVMAKNDGGYVMEHRLVMAKSLGRNLQPWEAVHHKNGRRDDNRLENLSLVLKGNHNGKVHCPFCHKEFNVR